MTKNDYVWYASYGSNINKDRFLCYILGGKPKGSKKHEKGCRDKSLPKDERPYTIHHQIYFAKDSGRWNGGVGFIGLEHNLSYETYSFLYLLSREQFLDVVRQENNFDDIDLDLDSVITNGNSVFRNSWYGNILYLGGLEEYPIFTFTSKEDLKLNNVRKPSREYLHTIILGLKREIGLNVNQIFEYLKRIPGIIGEFSDEDLLRIIIEG